MAEAELQQFLDKVRQLNAFVALSDADPALRQALRDCSSHHGVGSAVLRFDDEQQPRALSRGDQLLISAGRRHRVEATDPAPGTVWLALFWRGVGD